MDIGFAILSRLKVNFSKIILSSALLFFGVSLWSQGEVNCAEPITVYNQPGQCGATVTIPSFCEGQPANTSFYTVGIHDVTINCGQTACVVRVTVLDGEGPIFPSCGPVTLTLTSGACGPNALELVQPIDNCDALAALTILPANGNPYPINHEFGPGFYNLSYIVRDRSNNSSICSFGLTVLGVPNRVTSITCYKDLNLSVDQNCEIVVTPLMMLEGGPYGCLDEYIVTVFDPNNNPIGNTIPYKYLNQPLKTEVLSPDGNRCWGLVTLEDKAPPVLECDPIYTTCKGDIKPGSLLPTKITYKAQATDSIIPAGAPVTRTFNVDVFGLNDGSITDINVLLDVQHTNISQLSAKLMAPDGTMIQLFNGIGTCTNDDIYVFFDDEATLTNAQLDDSCGTVSPAVDGRYRPLQLLANLEGIDPTGIWQFIITDSGASDGGKINSLQITFEQTGNTIAFPTSNDITYQMTAKQTFLVQGLDNCTDATLTYKDSIQKLDCTSPFESIVYRTWHAEDKFGNQAIPCTQLIYVYRNDISSLIWPKNFDDLDTTSLSCLLFPDTIPGPVVTGMPHGDFCSTVQIFPYEDVYFPGCGNSYKILRRWKVNDWCTGRILFHDQIIKVADHDGPELLCPNDTIVSAQYDECALDFKPKRPTVLRECSDSVYFELSYYVPYEDEEVDFSEVIFSRDGVIGDSIILDLAFGEYYIKWIAVDECRNQSECIQKVTINDQISPVAVCKQFTTVSIGAAGGAEVDARSFDDLSYDNCEIVKYEAAKMVDICNNMPNVFKEKLRFCCEEVGKSIMVAFRVTDASGNSNTCMVEIKVEDKLPPYLICPDDITINCTEDYRDTSITGFPLYGDNCAVTGPPTFKDSVKIDQCGRGLVIRTWSVMDKRGYKTTCKQYIYLINDNPFNEKYIIWPMDLDTSNCTANLHPDSLPVKFARPIINYKDCSLTAVNYKDQVFEYAPGSCVKVLRRWTVLDWCNYNEKEHLGIYEHVQILKISNHMAPVFDSCQDVTVDVFDKCEGRVIQSRSAKDDCTPSNKIKYYYTIDLYSDNVNDNIFGNADSFNRILPVGKHKIKWTADDLCGNVGVCTYILTVRDGKKPTPYCLSSVTTVVMPSSGNIAIWAKDFDYGSSDNCTPKPKLKISFSSNVNDTGRIISCADIPDGRQVTIPLQMWVTDEAGNQEYCDVHLVVQDNTGNICPDNNNPLLKYSGDVLSEGGEPIGGVNVKLQNSGFEKIYDTKLDGKFEFTNVRGDASYELSASKKDNIRNGLNTIDLILIQRHILSLTKFKTPYKILASDFNKDGKSNVQDLVGIRKIILGIDATMPNNGSPWRFVDAASMEGTEFNNMTFSEVIQLQPSFGNNTNLKFIGIRLGDVDDSAVKSFGENILNPRNKDFAHVSLKESEEGTVDVYLKDMEKLHGLQWKLAGFKDELPTIINGQLQIAAENWIVDAEGFLTMTWFAAEAEKINSDLPIFSIKTKKTVLKEMTLRDADFNQAYSENLEIKYMVLEKSGLVDTDWHLTQNIPNPFNDRTNIGVDLPSPAVITFRVFDGLGRLIINRQETLQRGKNQITIETSELTGTGLYIYEVTNNGVRKMGKMMVTE